MQELNRLIEIVDKLLSPEGCPWDREQTLNSVRKHVIEEANEVVEAIEKGDNEHMAEEVGDLLFNVLFLCRLGEKENRFTTSQVIQTLCDKLVRRHPHVFGGEKLETSEQVLKQWKEIKQREKEAKKPSSK